MRIDVLYFKGCPNHRPTVSMVNEVVRSLGLSATIREIEVKDEADAERLRFFGSPTIQVNGRDIDPAAEGRRDHSFSCRMYCGSGLPPRELLQRALADRPAGS